MDNQQQSLINDLRAPIKSFRIFALEEAIKSGNSPEVLYVLEEIKQTEDDGECLMLLNHAISAVQERIRGTKQKPAEKIRKADQFIQVWQAADDTQKMKVLSQLPGRLPPELKPLGPGIFKSESSPVVGARIIRVFCRSWPEEEFGLITNCLKSESLALRLASLKTIVHMKPEQLVDDLPSLLNSQDPQVRALAIRGLAKIDKDEALNHLQALLLSSDAANRLAGIQNCLFLPFETVKPVLLKYFAAENHPQLLVRAGWILEMNPDIQVPFKLFEIAERSAPKKSELVKKILNDSVKLLQKSGILGDQFEQYTTKLKNWVFKRNATRLVKQLIAKLDAESIDPEVDQTIQNSLQKPVIFSAFKEALTWPLSDTVKARVKAYLQSAKENVAQSDEADAAEVTDEQAKQTEPEKQKPVQPVVKQDEQSEKKIEIQQSISLVKMPANEQIKFFTSLQSRAVNDYISEIKTILESESYDFKVKAAALNCLTRLKVKGFESYCVKNLTNSEVAFATSAVEYLGKVDPEAIFPYLGQCLKVADVRMKSAALGILKNFDYNQAVSSLNAMLKSTDPTQQHMALECMDQFDFSLIKDQLTEYLMKVKDGKLLEAGLCQFAANPSGENAYNLYKIEKSQRPTLAQKVKAMRVSPAQSKDPETGKSVSENELEQRLAKELEAKQKAYAYKNQPKAEEKPTAKETFESLKEFVQGIFEKQGAWLVGFLLIVSVIMFYFLFAPQGQTTISDRASAVVATQYTREGTVSRIVGNSVEFSCTEGDTFIFRPVSDGFRMPRSGVRLRVSLLPYRRNPNGVYLARLRSIRQIERFSED